MGYGGSRIHLSLPGRFCASTSSMRHMLLYT